MQEHPGAPRKREASGCSVVILLFSASGHPGRTSAPRAPTHIWPCGSSSKTPRRCTPLSGRAASHHPNPDSRCTLPERGQGPYPGPCPAHRFPYGAPGCGHPALRIPRRAFRSRRCCRRLSAGLQSFSRSVPAPRRCRRGSSCQTLYTLVMVFPP